MNIDLLPKPPGRKVSTLLRRTCPFSVPLLLIRETLVAGSVVPDSFFSG
jgi:hypothetical protein